MLAGMRNDLYWRNGYWRMELWNCGKVECTAWLVEGMTLCTMRMRTGMIGGMDEILMASLDLDVCIYNML